MGDKIERYSLLCMKLGTALLTALAFFIIGCVAGFAFGESFGFNGRLMDFLVFVFGVLGLVVGFSPAKKVFALVGWFFN